MNNKIRVNITVDKENLENAKKKLKLFGGKLSTLFNAYLSEFVESMDKDYGDNQKAITQKLNELQNEIKHLELRTTKIERERK
ncbi:MAG: hypothetical protein AABX66_02715 [Nanoarchaeota archaeon]